VAGGRHHAMIESWPPSARGTILPYDKWTTPGQTSNSLGSDS
jgi:hypothetical protein